MTVKENYKIFKSEGNYKIDVYYHRDNNGGGMHFGRDYITVLKERYPNKVFENCYEWCSGPGFIGYMILDHNLCSNLFLSDLWQPAIDNAEKTKSNLETGLQHNVHTGCFNGLEFMPVDWKFDLVVANPPHFSVREGTMDHEQRIFIDRDWKAHDNFYQHIKTHLKEDGIILIQENKLGSSLDSFRDMIESNGLVITDCFDCIYDPFYYIEIKQR